MPKCRLRFVGVLPFHRSQDRQWSVLLGLEEDGWGAFGGGPEDGDASMRQVAIREAVEESHGVLLRAQLDSTMRGPVLWAAAAAFYAIRVPHKVQALMDNVFAQQSTRRPVGGCFEKRLTCWVPLESFQEDTHAKWLENACAHAWPGARASPVPSHAVSRLRGPQNSQSLRALLCRQGDALVPRLERLPYNARSWPTRAIVKAVREANESCSPTDQHAP